jgi:membrane dipeptidase
LTDWGKKVITEMNRLGMIADISHVSEGVMVDVLENSKAPVIFSHSSVYNLRPHHRNVKDHVLDKLKVNDGVIMINFYSGFIGGNDTIFDVVSELKNF